MVAFLKSCGLSHQDAIEHREFAKFVWARELFSKLEDTDEGQLLLRRILTELCKLRDIPDESALDRDAGLKALRKLKQLAIKQKLFVEKEKTVKKDRASTEKQRVADISKRNKKLESIKNRFFEATTIPDRQKAGYLLESILKDVFDLHGFKYKGSYKLETQQIDGHFSFEGFDYLVEVRWRKELPTEGDISQLKHKAGTKIASTRGLFISVNGFRPEVIASLSGTGTSLILMDGMHITEVLEGRIDLCELLSSIIRMAAKTGRVYTPISEL